MLGILAMAGAFVLIVWMVRRRCPFGIAMISGSLLLGAASLSPLDIPRVLWQALSDPLTIELAAIVAFVSILGFCLKESGQLDALIASLRGALGDVRATLALIPAMIGLMPMPGGALLSAPFVGSEGEALGIGPEEKTFINHWFRHVLYYVFPLFPGLILAAELAGVSIYKIILIQIPLFIIAISIGVWISLMPIKIASRGVRGGGLQGAVLNSSPILIVILLNILLGIRLYIALPVGIAAVLSIRRVKLKEALKMVWKGISWELVLTIMGIMVFRQMIEASEVMDDVVNYLRGWDVPAFILPAAIPFLTGFLTGSEIAGIGISFPMIVPMLHAGNHLSAASLAYVSAFLGYLISPLHPCVALALGYFKPNVAKVYQKLIPSIIPIYLVALFLASLL